MVLDDRSQIAYYPYLIPKQTDVPVYPSHNVGNIIHIKTSNFTLSSFLLFNGAHGNLGGQKLVWDKTKRLY